MESELLEFLFGLQEHPEFLGCNPIGVNTTNLSGDTPLHVASVRGDINAVRLLLKNGADINARGEGGYTPLHEASAQGHLNIVRQLIESGADMNAQNAEGFTPTEIAQQLSEQEIVRFFDSVRQAG